MNSSGIHYFELYQGSLSMLIYCCN